MEYKKTIRGHDVTVHAELFTEDPSVGVPLGPDEIWAVDEYGHDFELEEHELDEIAEETSAMHQDSMED